VALLAGWGASACALADAAPKSEAEKLRDLGLASSGTATPGYGRVLIAFVIVAALAWGATWLLRRYGHRLPTAATGGVVPIHHVARKVLGGGVACHLVETQGRQVLITVARGGVSTVLLGDAARPPPDPPA